MVDRGWISGDGVPKKLAPLPFCCPICDAAGATKLRRGPLDTTQLPIGVLWHIDFTFYNMKLIQEFLSPLTIVEATERYSVSFPCRYKNLPIDLILSSSREFGGKAFL